ncbi:MAG: 7TM diverse intracellular signaling domain-containing protein [Bacteroidia bacterium]
MRALIWFGIYVCLGIAPLHARLVVENEPRWQIAGKSVYVFEDPTHNLQLHDIIEGDSLFQLSELQIPNFAYTESSWWFRLTIQNNSNSSNLALDIANSQLDEVRCFLPAGGYYQEIVLGDLLPFHERLINHQNFIIPIEVSPGSSKTIYFRIKSREQLIVPITVGHQDALLTNNNRTDIFAGIYFGIMLVMFFYNLFLYLSIRDKAYLFYILYIISIALAQATLLGYSFKYFWPEAIYFNHLAVPLFSALSGYGAIQFARIFLQLQRNMPRINRGLTLFELAYGLAVVLFLMGFELISYHILDLCLLTLSFYALYFSIHLSAQGKREAKFFLFAWSFFMVGMFVYVARNFGWLPYTFLTNNVLLIGSGIEAVLLSVALADRINLLKREKEQSQADALRVSLENEKLVREQNIVLEARVKERTTELENANTELEGAITELKNAQTQLVNAEKMASLGQLTAGIAHEINNPINFVTSNIIPLRRDLDDLLAMLEKFELVKARPGELEQVLAEIEAFKKEIDLDYLKEELAILLSGMEEGAKRTAEIVKGLRIFSRLDESDLKKVNINEGIDSTLILLNSSMGGRIDVVRDFDDDALLECFPGKLNQVIMNICNNAIQAMHSVQDGRRGELRISTKSQNNEVTITITDNGTGMPEEVRQKIFEPFFTTKAVGQGTGLGLSIVYSIIESHKGSISVSSEAGKGTSFTMVLPKFQK